ncbi:DUF6348 family protein [Actinomadura sp. 3N407]|uniref:DUF6348 family protein n=1 Tax=Actinomadura sp. 3N407 TaxID=3457423 RepID=UPI003FCCA028
MGIAAFCAGAESPSDDEVLGRLTGAGVEPWLAERLLIFLPMAYTRRLLPDVRFPDAVLDGETRVDATLFVHPAPAGVVMAQVDFAVSHPALATSWLVESFAGHGATWREAIGGALRTFERGSLHPIVDGLLRPGAAPEQVVRERYEHPGGAFELVLGAQLTMFTDRPVPSAGPLLDRLSEALRQVPLTPRVHGLRLFVAYHDGRLQTNEVLLDNEPWPGGEAVVAGSPAPLPDGRVAVRLFGLLVPVRDSSAADEARGPDG